MTERKEIAGEWRNPSENELLDALSPLICERRAPHGKMQMDVMDFAALGHHRLAAGLEPQAEKYWRHTRCLALKMGGGILRSDLLGQAAIQWLNIANMGIVPTEKEEGESGART